MKVTITDDPSQVYSVETDREKDIEGHARIMREDVEGAKEFAAELMKEPNMTVRRMWEREYYREMKEKYASGGVAGALLAKVWEWTKENNND